MNASPPALTMHQDKRQRAVKRYIADVPASALPSSLATIRPAGLRWNAGPSIRSHAYSLTRSGKLVGEMELKLRLP